MLNQLYLFFHIIYKLIKSLNIVKIISIKSENVNNVFYFQVILNSKHY